MNRSVQLTRSAAIDAGDVDMSRALEALDAAPMRVVVLELLDTPPGPPTFASRYLVYGTGKVDWTDRDNCIAIGLGSSWAFLAPYQGLMVRDAATAAELIWDGGSWVSMADALGLGALSGLDTVGSGQIDSSAVTTAKINDAAVTMAKLADLAALAIIGRSANSSGVPAAIVPAANGDSLERYNSTTVFQSHVGTSFPASPYNGMRFVRTDLDYDEFYYDGVRSKWLSVRTIELPFGFQSAVAAGAFLRPYQSRVGTSSFNPYFEHDATLVAVRAGKDDTATQADMDLTNAINTYQVTIPAATKMLNFNGLNVDFAANNLIAVKGTAATSGLPVGGFVTGIFRRKAT